MALRKIRKAVTAGIAAAFTAGWAAFGTAQLAGTVGAEEGFAIVGAALGTGVLTGIATYAAKANAVR
jgi:hypothetical protein